MRKGRVGAMPQRKGKAMDDRYRYRVPWSPEDEEYLGLCAEFPSLSHLAADQVEALVGIRSLVNDVVADMRRDGEPIPEPLASLSSSGKFVARVPPEPRRRMVIEAAEEGVRLNRLVAARLATTATAVTAAPKVFGGRGAARKRHPTAV
jgi:predicted HicB family RNase H-like nuclease